MGVEGSPVIIFCTECGHQLLEKPLKVDGFRVYMHGICFELFNIGED
jgi:hypothetical protein